MKETKNLLVTNKSITNKFNKVTLNLKANKAKTHYETLEGTQYLVVPCVMLTEGVHAGSEGPLYYPVDELSKTPAIWNHKPVVVYHPQFNGQSVSACDPIILEKYRIGELYNTTWEDGKLKTECWIDEEKANQVDERVLNAIEAGEMMEVSTGLFTDDDNTEGTWNGETYKAIARNYRPDHLAILPDLTGACSIEAGAGLLRNEAKEASAEGYLAQSLVKVFNELSHSDVWSKLNDRIRGGDTSDKWVQEAFDDFFIYEEGDKSYYQEYTIENDEVKLIGVRKEAEKITQYHLSDGTMVGNNTVAKKPNLFNNKSTLKKETKMDKKKVVDGLIANEKSLWIEDDREHLMAMSDERLETVVNQAKEVEPKKVIEPKAKEKTVANVEPKIDEIKPVENKEETVEMFISNAPKEMQDVLRSGMASHKADCTALIEKITANERNIFTPEQLQAKDLGELKALASLAVVPAPAIPAAPSFMGQGEILNQNRDANAVEEALEAPVMNFDKK